MDSIVVDYLYYCKNGFVNSSIRENFNKEKFYKLGLKSDEMIFNHSCEIYNFIGAKHN